MPDSKYTIQEFSQKIKSKYPQYKDLDDDELVDKIINKYPQYKDQVDLTKKKGQLDYSDQELLSPSELPGIATEKQSTTMIAPKIVKDISPGISMPSLSEEEFKKLANEKYVAEDRLKLVKENLSQLKGTLSEQESNLQSKIKEFAPRIKSPIIMSGGEPYFEEQNLPKEFLDAEKKLKRVRSAQKLIDRAEKLSSTTDKEGLKSFAEGIKSADWSDFFTLGMSEIASLVDILALQKKENPTEEEKAYLETYNNFKDLQSLEDTPVSYNVGKSLVDMVPYMVQFALTDGSASTVKAGIKNMLKSDLKTGAKKKAIDVLAYTGKAAVQTSMMPNTYKNILERKESGGSLAESITKGFASNMVEVGTEGLFGAPLTKQVDELVKAGKLQKMINDVRKSTKFASLPKEIIEEELSEIGNSIIDNDYSSLTDPKGQLTLLLTTSLVSGGFKGLEYAGKGADVIFEKIEQGKQKTYGSILDNLDEELPGIKTGLNDISELPINEQVDALDALFSSYDINKEGKKAVINYVANKNSQLVFDKVKEEKENAKKQQSGKVREQSIQKEAEGVGNKDMPEGDGAKLQDRTEIKKPEIIKKKEEKKDEKERVQKGEQEIDAETEAKAEEQIDKKEAVKPIVRLKETGTKKTGKLTKGLGDSITSMEIEFNGNKIGDISVGNLGNDIRMNDIMIDLKYQNKGYGTEAYKELNKKAEKQGGVLKSSETISKQAESVWKKLTDQGLAEKKDNIYQFIQEKPVEKKEAEEPKQVSFKFFGERKFGEVIEETKEGIKVREPNGRIHTLKKDSPFYKEISTDKKTIDKQRQEEDAFEKEFQEKLIKESESRPRSAGFISKKKQYTERTKDIFDKKRGVPKEAYQENLKVTGKVNRAISEAGQLVKDMEKQAKKSFQEYGDKEKEMLQNALENMGKTPESREQALKDVPEELREYVVRMRDNIDKTTFELRKLGLFDQEFNTKLDENTGYYVTRSYKKNVDKDWNWDNISDEIKLNAANKLHEYFPDLKVENVEAVLKSMLTEEGGKGFFASNYGKVDQSITKKRSQFLTDNKEIREFLGEHRDPGYNYANSMAKMTAYLEQAKSNKEIADLGLKAGWLKEEASGDFNSQIGENNPFSLYVVGDKTVLRENAPKQKGYKPLNEYYTTPEIKQAFENFKDVKAISNPLGISYMKAVTAAKLSKTAFSVKSIERNFLSNPINFLGNGNWNIHDIVKELNSYTKGNKLKGKTYRPLINEMKEYNIIGDNVDVGAIMANFRSLQNTNTGLLNNKLSNMFLKAYGFGDDFWKTLRFLSEKAKYQKVYEKQGKENAEQLAKDKAAEILHDTTAFYSQQPKLLQQLRKFPVMGTFVSFPYLTTRNAIHTISLARKEMRDKDTFHIGIQRMVGFGAAIGTLFAVALANTRSNGMDKDDVDDLRIFLPSFWKNDIIGIKKDQGGGKYIYKDYSFMDYYGAVTTPVFTLWREFMQKGDMDEDDVHNALYSFFEPYVSEDILFGKLKNLYQNYDPDKNRKINNVSFEKDPGLYFINSANYLWDAFEPGTLTDIRRTLRYKREGYDWKTPLIGTLTGSQNRVLDISKSLKYYNLKESSENISNYRWEYKRRLYDKKTTGDELIRQKMENAINSEVEWLIKNYEVAYKHGLSQKELYTIFKDSDLSAKVRDAVLYKKNVRLTKEGDIVF